MENKSCSSIHGKPSGHGVTNNNDSACGTSDMAHDASWAVIMVIVMLYYELILSTIFAATVGFLDVHFTYCYVVCTISVLLHSPRVFPTQTRVLPLLEDYTWLFTDFISIVLWTSWCNRVRDRSCIGAVQVGAYNLPEKYCFAIAKHKSVLKKTRQCVW